MKLELKELKKCDYKKAIQFAIKGMHFDWYMDSKLLLNLYGRYFWYLEMSRATQVISAYYGDEFAGVLLCEINGESKKYHSVWKKIYVGVFNFLQKLFAKNGVSVYDEANREMFQEYCRENAPDGEIIFLAANPDIQVKGIGSTLLAELERRKSGKKVYLYTDSGCTYQFYEHRGFELAQSRNVVLKIGAKTVPLRCLMYSKVLGKKENENES